MEFGKRIYFDKITGALIAVASEMKGLVKRTTVEQDIKIFHALSERHIDSFDYVELKYGEYDEDFKKATLLGIDPSTKELLFEYPNPETPSEPITPVVPLSKQIEALKEEGLMNMMAMVEMYEKNVSLEQENAATMLAVTEIYELLTGGD